ncbi:MAG TPA: carbohydrate porin [Polyangia bacterium]|nr:carbohydrate porin [Polyangia bacterium]
MKTAARLIVVALAILLASRAALAKNPEEPEDAPRAGTDVTFLQHGPELPYWFGIEANSIAQFNPPFHAPYSGTNSFGPSGDGGAAISGLLTVFTGHRPTRTTEIILDGEIAVGGGLSKALGIAGFTNLDVVRNPSLPHDPYVARLEIHQLIPLGDVWEVNTDRGPISSFAYVPRHRLEIRVGKMSTADLFDINPAGSDSHMQFMNWTVDNNGAWDYAADTRGYTYGVVLEYQGPFIEARYGLMLMPTVANGENLDWDIGQNRGENLELEIKYSRRDDWAGTLRLLGYLNHAAMGSYADAIAASEATGSTPDITASRQNGRTKYGFGINEYQELGPLFRAFGRIGWNDGKNESFAYTEVDNTFEIGGDVRGTRWRRPDDRVGLAFVSNGISSLHAEYLRRGGFGFILGDGPGCNRLAPPPTCAAVPGGSYLSYGRETIVEQYYNFHIWGGAFAAEDVQFVANPGYNSARGPVWVLSLRGHLEF